MDNISVLNKIRITLEGLLRQTQQLEGEYSLHQIDKDLMLEKTRALYEQIIALENYRGEEKVSEPVPVKEEDVPAVEEIAKTVVKEKEITPEIPTDENREILAAEPEESVPEQAEEPEREEVPVTVEKVVEPIVEKEPVDEKPKPVEKSENPAGKPKTMLDLFSEAPPETLGDTLKPTGKSGVADNLQMQRIVDLREAIGINDKFLFINELFNGDMERYNKVIDELNGFSGLSGAQTYLAELQVQYQWAEEGEAYQKLNVLLERKFA